MTAVIIDDEDDVLIDLSIQLRELKRGIQIVGNAKSVTEGVALIQEKKPDILFLDINLTGGTAFDLLEQIEYQKYMIVFISGEDFHGRRALEFEALAYLDKPVGKDDLIRALEIAEYHFKAGDAGQLEAASENFNSGDLPKKLRITNAKGYHYFNINEIISICSRGDRVLTICAVGRPNIHFTGTVRVYEQFFRDFNCVMRVHNACIAGLRHVIQIDRDWESITMSNKQVIKVARRRKKELEAAMEKCG